MRIERISIPVPPHYTKEVSYYLATQEVGGLHLMASGPTRESAQAKLLTMINQASATKMLQRQETLQ